MSDLQSTLIGKPDKMFAKQGKGDLKQQKEDWLVRISFFSELQAEGRASISPSFPFLLTKKG